jgi:hypothetical protein
MPDIPIPAHPTAVIAHLGRVGPHYPEQASDWIIVLRDRAAHALEVISLGVTHGRDTDPALLQSMIAKAEEILRSSDYRVGTRGPIPSTWAAAWAIGDTSDVIDVQPVEESDVLDE